MDEFESCKYMSNEKVAECFKTFSVITVCQEKITLKPQQNNKIKAFTQWVKDQYRLGMDPTRLPFPDTHTSELLRRDKTHQLFVPKSDPISKAEN